jgi:membrane protein YqaA with SNARE-associated domain|tara:strand:+ start:21 stop:470 length:450 start_codon:yes stop_codon:yes gene_type:complete
MESFVEWGFVGLFLASFLGATIIPLSSEIVLSILISKGYDLKVSIIIAAFGNWLGGLSSYFLGTLGKWDFVEKYFKIGKEKIIGFKTKIDKWGSVYAFFCCLPFIGDPLAVSLGFFRTNLLKVSVWMFFGKLVKYILWAILTIWGISIF